MPFTIELAFVSIIDGAMEAIASNRDLPYIGEFVLAGDDAMELPDMPAGSIVGVWLKRTVTKATIGDMSTLNIEEIDSKRGFNFKITF
jgi:hypothetical protein